MDLGISETSLRKYSSKLGLVLEKENKIKLEHNKNESQEILINCTFYNNDEVNMIFYLISYKGRFLYQGETAKNKCLYELIVKDGIGIMKKICDINQDILKDIKEIQQEKKMITVIKQKNE